MTMAGAFPDARPVNGREREMDQGTEAVWGGVWGTARPWRVSRALKHRRPAVFLVVGGGLFSDQGIRVEETVRWLKAPKSVFSLSCVSLPRPPC